MTKHASPRILDHLVLPVANIDVARKRYGQLGFTIGADAKHPFGTENCCIFFEDGTFLEPRSEERRVGKECRSRWSPYH